MLESISDVVCIGVAGELFGQCDSEGGGYRCVEQELAFSGFEPFEDLFEEVVRHRASIAGEVGDQSGGIGVACERHSRQSQSCRPPLGAFHQRGEISIRKVHIVFGQQFGSFVRGEGEIPEVEVEHFAVESQALNGKGRFESAGDDDSEAGRGSAQERLEIRERIRVVQQVCVVDDEADRIGELSQRLTDRKPLRGRRRRQSPADAAQLGIARVDERCDERVV
ncbi:hypothetical protein [Rhodococcus sp. AG1013]|uniref:hypothetical protein n=1 Tax=Rhodococcus sp. AG1013 TaxID=2183996 RepID=UPI00215DA14D|nr:hypothetical protein [Rhodococcus sp. AG1013]